MKENFIAIQAYPKKQEKSQINNLSFHLTELFFKKAKAKLNIRKEIMKIREKIKRRLKKKAEKVNETKRNFV